MHEHDGNAALAVGTECFEPARALDLALALQQITESDGTKPMPFPGVAFDDGEADPETLPEYESDLDRWLRENPLPTLPGLPG